MPIRREGRRVRRQLDSNVGVDGRAAQHPLEHCAQEGTLCCTQSIADFINEPDALAVSIQLVDLMKHARCAYFILPDVLIPEDDGEVAKLLRLPL
jgi:hypothetical protein